MSHFNEIASEWDSPEKVEKMKSLADKVRPFLNDLAGKKILDFGCGTGLLGLELFEEGGELVGVDTSDGMLEVFNKKVEGFSKVRSMNLDLESEPLNEKFDVIVTSMAFHHLNNPGAMVINFKEMLTANGVLAVVDLDQEDGTFHPDNRKMGVKHHGFSKDTLQSWATSNGLAFEHHIINKIQKNDREYGQFLALFRLL